MQNKNTSPQAKKARRTLAPYFGIFSPSPEGGKGKLPLLLLPETLPLMLPWERLPLLQRMEIPLLWVASMLSLELMWEARLLWPPVPRHPLCRGPSTIPLP